VAKGYFGDKPLKYAGNQIKTSKVKEFYSKI
jgi:hypothetical protein